MSNERDDDKLRREAEHVQQLVVALETTTSLIQNLLSDIRENSTLVGSLKTQIEKLEKDLTQLSDIVRGGNGQPSLLSRIMVLENEMKHLIDDLNKKERKEEHKDLTAEEINKLKIQTRLKLVVVVVSAILTTIGAIATYYFTG